MGHRDAASRIGLLHNEFWIQVKHLPPDIATNDTAEIIGSKFVAVEEYENRNASKVNWNGIVRLKVKVLVDKPLKPGFRVQKEDEKWFDIKLAYERLPVLCYSCGRIKHATSKYPFQVPVTSRRRFGPWMRAENSVRNLENAAKKKLDKSLGKSSESGELLPEFQSELVPFECSEVSKFQISPKAMNNYSVEKLQRKEAKMEDEQYYIDSATCYVR